MAKVKLKKKKSGRLSAYDIAKLKKSQGAKPSSPVSKSKPKRRPVVKSTVSYWDPEQWYITPGTGKAWSDRSKGGTIRKITKAKKKIKGKK